MADAVADRGLPSLCGGIQHPRLTEYAKDPKNVPFCKDKWAFIRGGWHSPMCQFIADPKSRGLLKRCTHCKSAHGNLARIPELFPEKAPKESAAALLASSASRVANMNTGTLKVISVPPSSTQLGLTVEFSARYSGGLVKSVNPELCNFADQVAVGDRIVMNNGRQVKCPDDLRRRG